MSIALKKLIFETESGDIDLTYDEASALYIELQVLFSGVQPEKAKVRVKKEKPVKKLDTKDWEKIFDDIKKESDKAWKNGTVEAGKKMFEKLSGDIME